VASGGFGYLVYTPQEKSSQIMTKVALVLHGWPESRTEDSFYYKYFKDRGYDVLAPNLFDGSFTFDIHNVGSRIKKQLRSRKIDVIVGISMGGLILPYIAKDHPGAKLIFIASGAHLKSKSGFFNLAFTLLRKQYILKSIAWILLLPDSVLKFFYQLANPFTGSGRDLLAYEKDMLHNIKTIKGIPVEKETEIINFVSKVDNTDLLRGIKNASLIYNGRKDLLMPAERGEELHQLLKNSQLIINGGEHFDVFTEKNLKDWDGFLKEQK
jgi:pimeloyl-ACP methyl ester carboxylesterase